MGASVGAPETSCGALTVVDGAQADRTFADEAARIVLTPAWVWFWAATGDGPHWAELDADVLPYRQHGPLALTFYALLLLGTGGVLLPLALPVACVRAALHLRRTHVA